MPIRWAARRRGFEREICLYGKHVRGFELSVDAVHDSDDMMR